MNSKLFGAVLLVVGTTIGAGMLALPVATAQLGFWGSLVLLVGCWAVMTACSFLFLEVNLWLPPNSNLISMAGATLGKGGQIVAWVFYLLLLYSILAAYIAGGGDMFHYILKNQGIEIPLWSASILFTIAFGIIVYYGIRSVDYVNRGLMFGKMGAFVLLAVVIAPFVTTTNLEQGEWHYIASPTSLSVTALSFACLLIIPSLRTYFGSDVKSLRKAVFIGTLIPLFCYIAWDMVIMGVIPIEGTPGLKQILTSANANSDLVSALTVILKNNTATVLANFFSAICMATAFLSVSLSLSDFLADGLGIAKKGLSGVSIVFGATFLPPIAVVLFYPDAFLRGLEYAGLSVFVLMVLLPPLMAWRGRYHQPLAQNAMANGAANEFYQVRGGKFLLAVLVIFATLMIGFGIEGAI